MKKQFLYWNIFVIFPLLLLACTKEESTDPSSTISLYGVDFRVEERMIWHDNDNVVTESKEYVFIDRYQNSSGEDVEDRVVGFTADVKDYQTGNFVVSLYGEGLIMNRVLQAVTGEGACISLHLASPDKEKLLPGKYVYSSSRDKYTFTGYSTSSYSSLKETFPINPIGAGEVEVEIDGNNYTIRLSGTGKNGGPIMCEYSGEIPVTDIRKNEDLGVGSWQNVALSAVKPTPGGWPDMFTSGFFYTNIGLVYSATSIGYWSSTEVRRYNVDIALAWDPANENVYFESPIKMPALLSHNDYDDMDFTLYGHTMYMNAPAGFSEDDFQNLSSAGLSFAITEEKVSLAYPSSDVRYVFFQNAQGVKGIIKVKRTSRQGSSNPQIAFDIKYARSYPFLIK